MEEQTTKGNDTELAGDEAAAKQESGRRKAKESKEKGVDSKLKLQLAPAAEHPLSLFLAEVKKRGIKNCDPGDVILAALEKIDEAWWEEKLDELTPLEYKITAALSDPNMREKLTSLLASQKLDADSLQ